MMTIERKDGEFIKMKNMNLIINENMRFSIEIADRLQELENENQELKKQLKEFEDLFDEDEMLRILNEENMNC